MPIYGDPTSHVFYRKLTRDYPRIVRGEGCYLYDAEGRRYLDGSGGAFVANLGHGVGEIADAIGAQARRLGYVNGTMFTHDSVEELATEIARLSPGDLDLVYPLASGSEAVEAALKLARQYWVEMGQPAEAQDRGTLPRVSRQHPARPQRVGSRALQDVLSRVVGGRSPGPGSVSLSVRVRGAPPAVSRLQW